MIWFFTFCRMLFARRIAAMRASFDRSMCSFSSWCGLWTTTCAPARRGAARAARGGRATRDARRDTIRGRERAAQQVRGRPASSSESDSTLRALSFVISNFGTDDSRPIVSGRAPAAARAAPSARIAPLGWKRVVDSCAGLPTVDAVRAALQRGTPHLTFTFDFKRPGSGPASVTAR